MSDSNSMLNNLEERYGKLTLTIDEAAAELGVCASDINDAIENGEIAVKRLGKKILIPVPSLISFLSDETMANKMANDIDSNDSITVTSNETIEIVEDDVDMAKGTTTYVKSAGLWIYQLDLGRTADGKRIRKSKSFKTQDEAKSALDIELSKLCHNSTINQTENNNIPDTSMTLKSLMECYLKLGNRSATARSLDSYYIVGRKISKEYGSYKLCDITPELLIMLFNKLKKECSDSTILKSYLFMKMIMEYAVSKKFLSANPMDLVKKPKSEKMKEDEYKAYTADELYSIMNAAKNYPEIYPILLMFENTGMRPGELRALKWSNVDFENKTISIKNAATYKTERESLDSKPIKTEYIGPTKSAYSVRTLSVSDVVIDSLKQWREYIDTNDKYKKAVKSEFLFPSLDGGFIKDDALRKMFRKFLIGCGLSGKGYNLYRFRHTICTSLIKSHVSIPVIQRIMGDNTTDVILQIYTSVNFLDVADATTSVQNYFNSINNN